MAAAAMTVAAPSFAQSVGAPDSVGAPESVGVSTWTGPYVGVNAGVGGDVFAYRFSGSADRAGANPAAARFRQSSSGGLVGAQIGYDRELSRGLVVGLVADLDATDITADSAFSSVDARGNAVSGRLKSRIDALGTVRGRVGQAIFGGRLLPYVTCGLAYGGVTTNADYGAAGAPSFASAPNFASAYATRTGWTAGVGVDYALSRRLSLRTEYLYTDLGRSNFGEGVTTITVPGVTLYNANYGERTTANILRIGLNYRF
jgi:outer membrane immunogenic protein